MDKLRIDYGNVVEQRRRYEEEAEELKKRRKELVRMADTLEHLSQNAPNSFYGAMNLLHLVAMMTTVDNFARMDVYMGDFLVHDLQEEVLTREEALDILERGENIGKVVLRVCNE